MLDRTPSLWIVALVAFAGLFHFVPSTSSPRGQTEAAPAGRGMAARFVDDTALKLLAQHYAFEGLPCPEARPPATPPQQTSDAGEALDPCVKEATTKRFREDSDAKVLFALVPDPIDSRGTYKFDEALEALQSGANDSGYLMDRFSLPWPRHALGADSSEQKKSDVEAFRSKPGVLLFRSGSVTGSSEGLLVVFVIGEIPTSGVQKPALFSALQQAEDLRGGPGEVRIIGPQFSGAAASLETVLRQWSLTLQGSQTVAVHFISANATNSEARERIDKIEFPPVKVEFHATVLPDDVIDTAMAAHFRRMNIDPSAIAILAESDSAYGHAIIDSQASAGWARYRLPYPMHASQVQTRYQKELVQGTQPLNIGEDPVHASLRLSLDDAEDPRDKPQLFAPGPSANVAELSLTAILQTLNREHINYVGLSGTDVRDKLFLARLIRSQFPNVQFFTDDSDILYAHPDYKADLWGMLIFSTYPLSSQSQTWTIPGLSRANLRQFSSQTAESIHHATRVALRDRLDNLEKYFMIKDDARELEDYNTRLRPEGPVVWITSVGHGGLWPVSVFDPWNGSAQSTDKLAEVNIKVPYAFVWVVVLLGTFGLATWSLYVRALRQREGEPRIATVFPTPTDGFVPRLVLFLYLISLFFIFSLLVWVTFLPPLAYREEPTALAALQAVAVAMLLPIINALRLAFVSLVSGKTFSKRFLWKSMVQDVVVLGVVLTVIAIAVSRTSFVERIMLFERATRFSSGVSPILPLIFLIVGTSTWVICFLSQMQVIRYAEYTRPFSGATDATAGEGFRRIQEKIDDAMMASYVWRTPRIEDYAVWGLAALAAVVGLSVPFFKTFEYLDHGWRLAGIGTFDAVLLVFFVALFGLLCWSARDFLVICYRLRGLLRRLTYHRLLPAFKRMSPKSSRGLSTSLLASTPTLAELQEPYDELVNIRNAFIPINKLGLDEGGQILPRNLDQSIQEIGTQLREEFKGEGAGRTRSFAFRSKSQQKLSKVAADILECLGKYWERPVFRDLSPDIRKDVDHAFELCENFVATQVVAYLNSVFLYLRYCLVCASTALLFLLLSTSSYPYSRQNLMMNFAWSLLLLVFCVYLYVFMQLERSEVLRAIRSDKGEESFFNRTVISQILLFGVIPALVFLGTKFPSLGRLLFAWTGPLLKAFNLSR